MRRRRLKECKKRTVKENPEYDVPIKIIKPEARNIVGPNEQSRD